MAVILGRAEIVSLKKDILATCLHEEKNVMRCAKNFAQLRGGFERPTDGRDERGKMHVRWQWKSRYVSLWTLLMPKEQLVR